MNTSAPLRVLALGAWLKNRACLLHSQTSGHNNSRTNSQINSQINGQINRRCDSPGDKPGVQWSALHGDLGDPAHCIALQNSATQLLHGQPVQAIAHDLHPDFYSTQLAQALAQQLGVPAVAVQHHHAHIAAVLAEHHWHLPVIGLALDGVGLGSDGQAWGGELLWVHGAQWRRLGHLRRLALPGGDAAAREPWRMAASVLHALGRGDDIERRFGAAVGKQRAAQLRTLLDRGLNCPASSSAGRWFDAAAGALQLCLHQHTEAEAALALERAAAGWLAQHPLQTDPALTPLRAQGQLDLLPLLQALLALVDQADPQAEPQTDRHGAPAVAQGAALFHAALADGLARWAIQAAQAEALDTVALGGGCFMNQVLTTRLVAQLQQAGLRVLQAQSLPCGDAGLALGQAWVAAEQLRLAQTGAPALAQPTAGAGLGQPPQRLQETQPCA